MPKQWQGHATQNAPQSQWSTWIVAQHTTRSSSVTKKKLVEL